MRFQETLKKRTEVLKNQNRRRKQFGAASSRSAMVQLNTPLFQFEAKQQAGGVGAGAGVGPTGGQPGAVGVLHATTAASAPHQLAYPSPPQYNPYQQQQQQQQQPASYQQPGPAATSSSLGLRERRRAAGSMMSQQLIEEEADLSKHATQRMNFAHGVEKVTSAFQHHARRFRDPGHP